jgi:predicted nucleic acid-binding protein
MEWLTRLQGQIVGLDTAPLIYFIEENSIYLERVCAFFTAMEQGEFQVVSSTLILTEVLVHPLRASNTALAQDYRDILCNQENLTIVSVSPAIAERAAQLRAKHNLRTPDAIQIATALQANATFFITNDTHLPAISDLEILVLDKL